MRIIFVLFLVLSLKAQSQFERSSRQLAAESVKEYLTRKVFKGKSVSALSAGQLKRSDTGNREISWTYSLTFNVISGDGSGKTTSRYSFIFYLDDRMHVVSASSWEGR